MDFSRDSEFPPDLSPLAWVQEELRRTLEAVHKSLRRLLRDVGDTRAATGFGVSSFGLDAIPSQPLQTAATQLHQVAGVLQLVGLPAGSVLLRASELALQKLAQEPSSVDAKTVELIERAHFALLSLIARLLAGTPASTLALFPSYRDLQSFNQAERVHPADLWQFDWRWQELPLEPGVAPLAPAAARASFESTLLKQMRSPTPETASALGDLCASIAAGSDDAPSRTLWQLAAAQFEAQALGLLPVDALVKRLGSRLLTQLRSAGHPDAAALQRLAQDLLFFCASSQEPKPGQAAPRLAGVRAGFALPAEPLGTYEDESLGRIDPTWVAQARRRVTAAKESWGSVAEGETTRLPVLDEQFAALSESLQRLFPSGEVLGKTLQRAAVATLRSGQAPAAALAMEVATSMLYVEAALDDAAFDQPEQAERVRRLAARIDAVAHGQDSEPLEDWMEELYRRVSDRQTLGSVVHELRSSLQEVERRADEYFRQPSKRELLIPVPAQLSAMRGVLTVLGLAQAALACVHMRDEVDELANTEIDTERAAPRELFDRLANNLGALGFLIDMLSVQPQLAKRMFRFDEASGLLSPVMGRRAVVRAAQLDAVQHLAEEAAPDVATDLDLSALTAPEPGMDFMLDLPEPAKAIPLEIEPAALVAPAEPGESGAVSEPGPDAEMLEVFLEEASEVLASAQAARAVLESAPTDHAALAEVRRAFHTLKGSSRMVGLADFGEGAWACEQLFNDRLLSPDGADAALLAFTAEALDYLSEWREEIAAQNDRGDLQLSRLRHRSGPLRDSADALRLQGQVLPLEWPQEVIDSRSASLDDELAMLAPDLPQLDLVDEAETPGEPGVSLREPGLNTLLAGLDGLDIPTLDENDAADATDALLDDDLALPELEASEELRLSAASDVATVHQDLLMLDAGFDIDLSPEAGAEPGEAQDAEVLDFELPEFDLTLDLPDAAGNAEAPAAAPLLTLVSSNANASTPEVDASDKDDDADDVKVIGDLRISITLFNIFLNEADELSRRLAIELAEWALELTRPAPASGEALAHALAGSSATVGFSDLADLARELEHALGRAQRASRYAEQHAQLFVRAAEDIRRLLHQFAAGFLKPVDPELLAQLHAYQAEVDPESIDESTDDPAEQPQPLATAGESAAAHTTDVVDVELLPIFEEEAYDLLRDLHAALRDWSSDARDSAPAAAAMRSLHTFKGGARLCGALGLGEQAHQLESVIEQLTAKDLLQLADVQALQERADALESSLDALLQGRGATPAAAVAGQAPEPAAELAADTVAGHVEEPLPEPALESADESVGAPPEWAEPPAELPVELVAGTSPEEHPAGIDWARFGHAEDEAAATSEPATLGSQALLRVRAAVLERMAAQAGEVSIRRARLESELAQMKSSLLDLDDNLDRLRSQLRELELQAEAQIGTQREAQQTGHDFDPLEFDRYTRLQELSRMLTESVGDVATLQRSLQRNVQLGEDEMAAQSRLTRELQDDLLRTRMVEFDSLAERLHRVVRQAARESGKQVQLDIIGAHTELDRSVLERMAGAFEHLLRNCVTHGIEAPELRLAAGKPALGTIKLEVKQEGNEVRLDFSDDGAGLNLQRIRERGELLGLIKPGAAPDEQALMQLVFTPGFSTAAQVTELAGRGVGMDVVRAEASTLGGSVEISSQTGQGAHFLLRLPLTTALTQVVLLRCGELVVAVPASLLEAVQRLPPEQLEQSYAHGAMRDSHADGDGTVPFYWLGGLLGQSGVGSLAARQLPVLLVRSAQQRLALHVDEVLGNQEVVVKNLGPQLSRVPGLAGISLLASGEVALIYNPVALANWYGTRAQAAMREALAHNAPSVEPAALPVLAPLVLVVDDSLTVRRVTQRLLEREGYRVQLAKDGLDALEQLEQEELPALVLSDIEMPRMDGFDLVRNMKSQPRLAGLPIVMITSRIAQKHRDFAMELGVRHYLGKPFDEDELLGLIARYTAVR